MTRGQVLGKCSTTRPRNHRDGRATVPAVRVPHLGTKLARDALDGRRESRFGFRDAAADAVREGRGSRASTNISGTRRLHAAFQLCVTRQITADNERTSKLALRQPNFNPAQL